MIYKGIKIPAEDIKSLIPSHNRMLLAPRDKYMSLAYNDDFSIQFFICVDEVSDADMRKIKFEYLRYIKLLPDPEDRVADFEYLRSNLTPDFEKRDKLIENRKTKEELQKDKDRMIGDIEAAESMGIDCTSIKELLKEIMQGGIK